jgi:uncharacterized protein (DUF2236 family)
MAQFVPRAQTRRLSPSDRERLQRARGGKPVAAGRSLFGPKSVTWQIDREAAVLLGGGRALLLQIAHPLVAAGVAEHSHFREDPLARLWRTLDLMLTLVFADAAAALKAVREIERVHTRVRGTLPEDVGPFARGTPYDASDPTLLYWVYATLVDSALLVYERFVAPLSPRQRDAYFEESKIGARLLGVPEPLIPATFPAFQDYVRTQIEGDVLSVGRAGREVAEAVLHPPVALPLSPAFCAVRFFAIGLLPPSLRERLGLGWGRHEELLLDAVAAGSRQVVPWLPGIVRFLPHARRAAGRAQQRR